MSRQPNIRWRKSDNEKLRKAVKNYNAKISRLEKSKPELSGALPMRQSVPELRDAIQTRADYNNIISKLKDFSQREIDSVYDVHVKKSINWTDKRSSDLSEAVKQFNMKIDRLSRENPKIKNALPERATVKHYKKIIDSPADLNRELKSLRGFLQEGAEELVDADGNNYNLKLTRWQKEEMLQRLVIINAKREERKKFLESLELTDRGKKLGYTAGEFGMGSADDSNLSPMNAFTEGMNRVGLEKKWRGILKESAVDYWKTREAVLKATYIRTLRENFKEKDIRKVIGSIEDMDLQSFYSTFKATAGKFEDIYYPDQEQYDAYLEGLKSSWIPDYAT